MSKIFQISKNDCDDLGFTTTSLIGNVISFEEFKEWIYFVIEQSNDVPDYIFDILDAKEKFDYTLRVSQIIGYNPYWECSKQERYALYGIAYKRNAKHESDAVLREEALKALEKNPHILQRFRETFPFIDFEKKGARLDLISMAA